MDRGVVPGPPEQLNGHSAVDADHLADDDVGVVAPSHRVQPAQGLVAQPVVLVDELHVLADAASMPTLRGPAGPAGARLVEHPDLGVLLGQPIEQRRSVIGGSVVDEDELELVGRHRLGQQ